MNNLLHLPNLATSPANLDKQPGEGTPLGPSIDFNPSENAGTFISLFDRSKSPSPSVRPAARSDDVERRLFDALAAMKMKTAEVAMHLSIEWRNALFAYLDMLHDAEDWDSRDEPAKIESFTTFLRMILFLSPLKRPGMGLTVSGIIVATWTEGSRHLTIECLAADVIAWSVAIPGDGDVEVAAGKCKLQRISEVLRPYRADEWFGNGPRG